MSGNIPANMKLTRRQLFLVSGGSVLGLANSANVSADEDYESVIEDILEGAGASVREELDDDPAFFEGLANELTDYEDIDVEQFEEGVGATNEQLRQTRKVVDVVNNDLNLGIPSNFVDSLEDVDEQVGKVDKYLPVVAACQNCLNDAKNYQEVTKNGTEDEIEEAQIELFISILLLACEVCLLQSSTAYNLSFAGTRYAANHGLFRVQRHVGNKTYALLLSEVHWGIRGTLANIQTKIIDRSTTIARNVHSDLGWEAIHLGSLRDLRLSDLEDYDFLEEYVHSDSTEDSDDADETNTENDNNGLVDSISDRFDDEDDDGWLGW
ncbi:hypothetical protein [Natronolimnobius baerhuensis]|uniref:Uncharacterized protein n=1 Tax=Natronolimnobius baerhuensis TaxID=253108 RepID=A0A202E4Q3_9EURY|nr:hypothetical protein [Natronolimnobius baerhuensis]OVE83184.1 hypothetical protein B2G88_17400 [Natronolimnobius baerhuensis]